MNGWFMVLFIVLPTGERIEEIPPQKPMTDQQCVAACIVEANDRPGVSCGCLPTPAPAPCDTRR